MNYLIGIDLGTSSTKGILLDEDGKIRSEFQVEYSLETNGLTCELDPEVYWLNVQQIIGELVFHSKVNPFDIKGIACSSQAETLICVDKDGNALRKAIVWLDNRSSEEAKELEQYFSRDKIFMVTGQPEVLPTWPATKILWLKKNEPEIFQRVHQFLMVEDYIVFRLCGRYVTEPSVSSSTLYLNIYTRNWWYEMLNFIGISAAQLPAIQDSGTKIDQVTGPLQSILPATLVVTGSYDHAAGAIGAGNTETGCISETTGSSMAMVVTLDKPLLAFRMNLPCQVHSIPGKYFLLPYGQTAGMVLKWLVEILGKDLIIKASVEEKDVYDLITEEAALVAAGSEGLTMLPHLMGAGSPEFNADCKGVYAGLTLGMNRGHFVRSLMESIAAMIKKNIDIISEQGFRPKEIRGMGGGAKSALWNQMKADMTGLTIKTLHIQEAPSLGVAILAGVGSGVFASIEEGCNRLVKVKDTYTPNIQHRKVYQEVYNRYLKLYGLMYPFWEK